MNSSHFAFHSAAIASLESKFFFSASAPPPRQIPQSAVARIITNAGTIAPRNIFSIGTLATIAYTISGRQGGSNSPSEPAPVNKPSASLFDKPEPASTGITNQPTARIVTPEAPVKDVKKAHTSTVTIAAPPLNCPNNA